jgi:hypothetical protein
MNYDEWMAQYEPIQNTHDKNASMDGTMFETYGPEVEQVKASDYRCVWTLVDCDGREVIESGWHLVNRLGYFITAKPFDGDDLEVSVLTDEEHAELQNNDSEESVADCLLA